jgi:hypothetical protein
MRNQTYINKAFQFLVKEYGNPSNGVTESQVIDGARSDHINLYDLLTIVTSEDSDIEVDAHKDFESLCIALGIVTLTKVT